MAQALILLGSVICNGKVVIKASQMVSEQDCIEISSYDYLKRQDIFDAAYVSDMIRQYIRTGDAGPATGANYSKLTWSFFVFQQWYQAYHG